LPQENILDEAGKLAVEDTDFSAGENREQRKPERQDKLLESLADLDHALY
jgi:hypothetical protein